FSTSTASVDMAALQAEPFVPQLYRVGRVRRELADTMTLELAPLAGPRPTFEPGQFNMLYAFGVGEVAISISGAADATSFVHTIREVGAVSTAIAQLKAGAMIGLRGPYGTSWPVVSSQGADVVFVAGGLAPAARRAARHLLPPHPRAASAWRRCVPRSTMSWPTGVAMAVWSFSWAAVTPRTRCIATNWSSGVNISTWTSK